MFHLFLLSFLFLKPKCVCEYMCVHNFQFCPWLILQNLILFSHDLFGFFFFFFQDSISWLLLLFRLTFVLYICKFSWYQIMKSYKWLLLFHKFCVMNTYERFLISCFEFIPLFIGVHWFVKEYFLWFLRLVFYFQLLYLLLYLVMFWFAHHRALGLFTMGGEKGLVKRLCC